jgi:hypothetical protein
MSVLEEVIKALEAVVAPELKAMNERLEAYRRENTLRFESLEAKMDLRFDGLNARFDDLLQRLALERRISAVETELDEKRRAS